MERLSDSKIDLIIIFIVLGTIIFTIASIVVVIYAWVSGNRTVEDAIKVLCIIVIIGAMLIAGLLFMQRRRK
jgi:uncharacterized membrane protein